MFVTVVLAAAGGCDAESAEQSLSSGDFISDFDRERATAGRGVPAPSQVTPERPRTLVLPDGTRMPVVPVGTEGDGALELPPDVATAGWWEGGSRLGDPFGALVVAAHVDSFTQGIGPFVQLLTMRPGQRIQLVSRSLAQTFVVDVSRFVPRSSLAADPDAFALRGPFRLVLITCGGPYDADAGGYRDNVVVVAGATARR